MHAGHIFSEKLMNIANFIYIYLYISPDTLKSYYGIGPDFEKAASLRKPNISRNFQKNIFEVRKNILLGGVEKKIGV